MDTKNMVFTSGDPNPLGEENEARRFIVVDNTPASMGLSAATVDSLRAEEVQAEYGKGARLVQPYKPNRKQRRAQQSRRKK